MSITGQQMHPSQFQMNDDISFNKKTRTLDELSNERESRNLFVNNVKLESPGSYKLTPDDNFLNESNVSSVFKDISGNDTGTLLQHLFFSRVNIENIQKLIRMLVYKEMGLVIDDQSINELMICMKSMYLQYSRHPLLINEKMSIKMKNKLYGEYRAEIGRLNEIVLDDVVPRICSQLQQYLTYLDDASSPMKFMDQPINESKSGKKVYRSVTSVLTGGNF